MAQRALSETGWYHVATRSAGQIALFEDDADRKKYLSLLREVHEQTGIRIIAWVLMTDHTHLIIDCGDAPSAISDFMFQVNSRYSRYFNAKTGRSGTLFQGEYWSKPIDSDEQLIATIHYVHMNPEYAGLASMREYRWSSYREYAGTRWITDTSVVLDLFGSFEAFDTYEGSPKDVVKRTSNRTLQDEDVLALAIKLAGVKSSSELRTLPIEKRNNLVKALAFQGASTRKIARALGIGHATAARILAR